MVTQRGRDLGTDTLLGQLYQFSPGEQWMFSGSLETELTQDSGANSRQHPVPCVWKPILIGGSSREKSLDRLGLRVLGMSSRIPTGSFPAVSHLRLLCHLNPAPWRRVVFMQQSSSLTHAISAR